MVLSIEVLDSVVGVDILDLDRGGVLSSIVAIWFYRFCIFPGHLCLFLHSALCLLLSFGFGWWRK